MSAKKRLLVLTSTFPRWQGDREPPFVFELCRRLATQFDVVVLAPHAPGSLCHEVMSGIEVVRFRYSFPCFERLAYQGGILSNLKQSRWRYLLLPCFFFGQLMALCRILRRTRIDAIHAHWLIPQGLTVALASLLIRKIPPLICTSHGGDLLGLNGALLNRLKRWVVRRTQMLTVVSYAMRDPALALGISPKALAVIPMGVDTEEIFVPQSDVRRADYALLFVGRLVEKKGATYLLAALPMILERYPEATLDIIGSGPEECRLRALVEELGINHAVHFCGALDNSVIPSFFRRASMLIMPSLTEGLGLVLVEALACECPVIATNLPTIRDVVIHQRTGLVVQEKNASAIAEAVIELLGNSELRRSLAVEGRKHVKTNFDWMGVTARYSDLIQSLSPVPTIHE